MPRQCFVPDGGEVQQYKDGGGQADGGEVEKAEGLETTVDHHAGHDEVGGGADERDDASGDGCVGERNEEAGGGDAGAFGPFLDLRDEHGHDGGVVEEGGEKAGGGHHAEDDGADAEVVAEDGAVEEAEGAGASDGGGDDEEGGDGENSGVGEAGEGLLGGEDAGDEQHDEPGEEDEVGAGGVADEGDDDRRDGEGGEDQGRPWLMAWRISVLALRLLALARSSILPYSSCGIFEMVIAFMVC